MHQSLALRASLLAIAASALLSFTDNFVGLVSQESGLWQFQLFRTLFALPIITIGVLLTRANFKVYNVKKIAVRSTIISIGLLIYFSSLGFLPVAQAGAGLFSAPIWVMFFSIVFFKNKASLMKILTISVGFIGVLMLLQPDTQNLTLFSLFPLIAGAFYGFGMLITRYWCSVESAVALTLGVFICMGIISIIMVTVIFFYPTDSNAFIFQGWKPITANFLVLTFLQSLGGVISVTLITQAYKIGEPSFTSIFEYTFLIFAAVWTFLLWGETTNEIALFGVIVIISSGISLSVLNHKATKNGLTPAQK